MSTSSDFIDKESQSQPFIYDNCIIRLHEDSDVSDTSVFSWRKTEDSETSSFSETSEEEDEKRDEDLSHLKLSVKETFIMMLGFLNKIEKHFTENEELNEELKLLQLVLINSAESFGFDVGGARRNGVVGKEAKTSKQARKSDTLVKQTQPGEMDGGADTSSDTAEKPRRKSTPNKNKEKTGQRRQSEKRKSSSSPSGDDRRVSKRVKRTAGSDRLSNTAAKIKQGSVSPLKRVTRARDVNLKSRTKDKYDDSSDAFPSFSKSNAAVGKKVSKGVRKPSKVPLNPSAKPERRKLYCSERTEDKSNDSSEISPSFSESKPGVGKEVSKGARKQPKVPSMKPERRKLYCSETWLDMLSSTTVP